MNDTESSGKQVVWNLPSTDVRDTDPGDERTRRGRSRNWDEEEGFPREHADSSYGTTPISSANGTRVHALSTISFIFGLTGSIFAGVFMVSIAILVGVLMALLFDVYTGMLGFMLFMISIMSGLVLFILALPFGVTGIYTGVLGYHLDGAKGNSRGMSRGKKGVTLGILASGLSTLLLLIGLGAICGMMLFF